MTVGVWWSRGRHVASGWPPPPRLYRTGWTVVAAMRSPEEGMERLRELTGAGLDDPRLIGIRLDLDDDDSIAAAGEAIQVAVGAPYGLVHNAASRGSAASRRCP